MFSLAKPSISLGLLTVSAIAAILQAILGDLSAMTVIGNWLLSGVLAFILWDTIAKHHLGRDIMRQWMVLPWVLGASTLNNTMQWMDLGMPTGHYYLSIVLFVLVTRISFDMWQNSTESTISHLLQGLLIGGLSTAWTESLLWLLLVLPSSYLMRSLNVRNILALLSGALMGIWIVFCYTFFVTGQEEAIALLNFIKSFDFDFVHIGQMGQNLFNWLTVLGYLVMISFFFVAGHLPKPGNNLRTETSEQMTAFLQVPLMILLIVDGEHLALYNIMGILLIGLQMVIVQSNSHSAAYETGNIVAVVVAIALQIATMIF